MVEQAIAGLMTALFLVLLGSFYIDWRMLAKRAVMRVLVWHLGLAAELWYLAHTLKLVDWIEYNHEIDRVQRYKLRWQLWLIDHKDD